MGVILCSLLSRHVMSADRTYSIARVVKLPLMCRRWHDKQTLALDTIIVLSKCRLQRQSRPAAVWSALQACNNAGCFLIWARVNRLLRLMKSLSCQSAAELSCVDAVKKCCSRNLSLSRKPALLLCAVFDVYLATVSTRRRWYLFNTPTPACDVTDWSNQKLNCLQLVMSDIHFFLTRCCPTSFQYGYKPLPMYVVVALTRSGLFVM